MQALRAIYTVYGYVLCYVFRSSGMEYVFRVKMRFIALFSVESDLVEPLVLKEI